MLPITVSSNTDLLTHTVAACHEYFLTPVINHISLHFCLLTAVANCENNKHGQSTTKNVT